MFFELDGKTYCIKFHRNNTTTFAELLHVDSERGLVHLGIVAWAALDSRDIFVKKTGRKRALTNLLNALSDEELELPFKNISKEDRAKIWATYFSKHKK